MRLERLISKVPWFVYHARELTFCIVGSGKRQVEGDICMLARHAGSCGKCGRLSLGGKGDQLGGCSNPDEQRELTVRVGEKTMDLRSAQEVKLAECGKW